MSGRRSTGAAGIISLVLMLIAFSSLAIDSDRARQEDDIREAMFRYQFDHNELVRQPHASAYCLAILVNGKDSEPVDAFMKRFAHHHPAFRSI